MALNEAAIQATAKAAVKAAYLVAFPSDFSLPPENTIEENADLIADLMAVSIVALIPEIVRAVIEDAEVLVTDVTAGAATAPGTIS